jgi:hypothetical protein
VVRIFTQSRHPVAVGQSITDRESEEMQPALNRCRERRTGYRSRTATALGDDRRLVYRGVIFDLSPSKICRKSGGNINPSTVRWSDGNSII